MAIPERTYARNISTNFWLLAVAAPQLQRGVDDQDGSRSVFPKAMSLLAAHRGESDANALCCPATIFAEYEMHLRDRCGLADDTIRRNLNVVRDFHRYAFGSEKTRWRALKPCVVLNFFRYRIELGKTRS